jgi:hypothetical protein
MDKFNPVSAVGDPAGYAMQTRAAFEALCQRGNIVQITLRNDQGTIEIQGLLSNWEFDYKNRGDIGYNFTFSPHQRPNEIGLLQPVVPGTNKDAATLADEIELEILADLVILNDARPNAKTAGDLSQTTTARVEAMSAAGSTLSDVVNNRVLATDTDTKISLRGAIAAATTIISTGQVLTNQMGQVRSDTDLMYQDALGILNFETWARGLSAQARLAIFRSNDARRQLDEQQAPDAIALYKPYEGESLYRVSERFYGTPHNWDLIKQRNGLPSSKLSGNEVLIIPEAPLSRISPGEGRSLRLTPPPRLSPSSVIPTSSPIAGLLSSMPKISRSPRPWFVLVA